MNHGIVCMLVSRRHARSSDRLRSHPERQKHAGREAARPSGSNGHHAALLDFPDYETAIGQEIPFGALHGRPPEDRADVLQLLDIANRYEQTQIRVWLGENVIVICDCYLASSVAYGGSPGARFDLARRHAVVACARCLLRFCSTSRHHRSAADAIKAVASRLAPR